MFFDGDGRVALEILGVELRNMGCRATARTGSREPANTNSASSPSHSLQFPAAWPDTGWLLLTMTHRRRSFEQITQTGATAEVLLAGAAGFEAALANPHLQGVVYLTASATPDETQRIAGHALTVLQC